MRQVPGRNFAATKGAQRRKIGPLQRGPSSKWCRSEAVRQAELHYAGAALSATLKLSPRWEASTDGLPVIRER